MHLGLIVVIVDFLFNFVVVVVTWRSGVCTCIQFESLSMQTINFISMSEDMFGNRKKFMVTSKILSIHQFVWANSFSLSIFKMLFIIWFCGVALVFRCSLIEFMSKIGLSMVGLTQPPNIYWLLHLRCQITITTIRVVC